MMTIYGGIKNGQKVIAMRDGSGYEYVSYISGAKKQKTPQASGAQNSEAVKYYNQHNAAINAVNKKINVLI